jgi:hypothetical protein
MYLQAGGFCDGPWVLIHGVWVWRHGDGSDGMEENEKATNSTRGALSTISSVLV